MKWKLLGDGPYYLKPQKIGGAGFQFAVQVFYTDEGEMRLVADEVFQKKGKDFYLNRYNKKGAEAPKSDEHDYF